MDASRALTRAATTACLAALVLAAPPDLQTAELPPLADLDGMTFVGELQVSHTGRLLAERLTFDKGLFHSLASDSLGYTDGPYAARRVGEVILFDAFTESPAMGSMVWRGRISGGELGGRATAREPGEPETHFIVRAFAID